MKKLAPLALVLLWAAIAHSAYNLAVSLNRFALDVLVYGTVGTVFGLIGYFSLAASKLPLRTRVFALVGGTLVYTAVVFGTFAFLHGTDKARIVVERDGQRRILEAGWHCNLRDRLVVFAPAYLSLDETERFTFEERSGSYIVRGELESLRIVIPNDRARLLQASGVDNLSMRTSFEAVKERIEQRAAQQVAAYSESTCASAFSGTSFVQLRLEWGGGRAAASVSGELAENRDTSCPQLTIDLGDEPLDPMLTALGARVEDARVSITSRDKVPTMARYN